MKVPVVGVGAISPASKDQFQGRAATILIVEDEEFLRQAVSKKIR